VRYSPDKKNFGCLSNCRYCTQNLPGPAPNSVLTMFQMSSKSVHFRRNYSVEYFHYRLFEPITITRTTDSDGADVTSHFSSSNRKGTTSNRRPKEERLPKPSQSTNCIYMYQRQLYRSVMHRNVAEGRQSKAFVIYMLLSQFTFFVNGVCPLDRTWRRPEALHWRTMITVPNIQFTPGDLWASLCARKRGCGDNNFAKLPLASHDRMARFPVYR